MKQYTLKQAREKIGLTQEELANKLGRTVAAWNYKENYKRALTAKDLILLSKLAKLDPRQIKI